ncbi:MAG TPA: hypothetical protein VI299_14595, partial [Polyangiales bacterium]
MAQLPQPAPEPAPITPPEDVDYPGTIELTVDATDIARGIFHAREILPVRGGRPLTLLYPKWLPGYHAPQSPIASLTGLEVVAHGKRIPWRRDDVEVYAFHIEVPEGAERLELTFQFVSPTHPAQGRIAVSTEMLNLQWNTLILYPAGHFSRRIRVAASVKLPEGWRYGCALEHATLDGGMTRFAPVALDVLVDSPLFTGKHYRSIDLDASVRLNLVADRADLLEATRAQIDLHRALIVQADKLFGSRPPTIRSWGSDHASS